MCPVFSTVPKQRPPTVGGQARCSRSLNPKVQAHRACLRLIQSQDNKEIPNPYYKTCIEKQVIEVPPTWDRGQSIERDVLCGVGMQGQLKAECKALILRNPLWYSRVYSKHMITTAIY